MTDFAVPRVLVVDGHADAGERLAQRLHDQHFDVTTVHSGAEALDALDAALQSGHPFELIFVGWLLPDMDGLEAARRVRERLLGDALPLPLVMLTTPDGAPPVLDHLLHGGAWRSMPHGPDGTRAGSSRAARPAPPPSELAGTRVLLAEDDPINQEVAQALLDHAGIVSDVASDGVAAVRLVRERHYDAVLMDMQMPVMDGIDAVTAIRALPEHASLPIIAMTANALPQDRARCLAAGMNDHLSKPIDPTLLWQTLLRWARPDALATPSAATPPAAAVPAASAPAEPQLPSGIAGLDVDEALNRLGGRTALYLSVLKMFVANHHNTAGQIQAALQEGRRTEALRLAHTLRGAAASVGARELSEAAGGLEVALASQAALATIEPKLLRLGSRLDALVTALQRQLA